VAKAIREAVLDALDKAYPKRCTICSDIVAPGQSLSEYARPDIDLDPSRDADALDRATERLREMRWSD
jgi:hypothetical protein